MREKEHIFLYKFIYMAGIMLVYMIGRNIPLYGIDLSHYQEVTIDAQTIMVQSLTGDMKNCSVFTLGLWPYMLSSIVVMLAVAILSLDKTRKLSPKKMNLWTLGIMLVISICQAYGKMQTLVYRTQGEALVITKAIVFVEMIVGMLVVIYLGDRMTKYGIGGRTSIFFVNIIEGFLTMLVKTSPRQWILPLSIGLLEIVIMLILENAEKRIAVQRVSIHNIYADKNYIAYKLNPIGAMPLMFSSAIFMLPHIICTMLLYLMPGNSTIQWILKNIVLTEIPGIWVYMGVVCLLTISLSFVMLSPGTKAEELMKVGDSILDIYAGRQTKKYLVGNVLSISAFSAIVMSCCMGLPLFLQFKGYMDPALVMFPSSLMMLSGLWITLYREAEVYRNADQYRPLL